MSDVGQGNSGRKLIWHPTAPGSYRTLVPAYFHQTSVYSVWDNVSAGITWAPMSSGSFALDVGGDPDQYAFGPVGGLVPAGPQGTPSVGARVKCRCTFAPEFSLALGADDWMHFVIAQASEGISGGTAAVPDGEMALFKPVLNSTLPLAQMSLMREFVWDGSPIQVWSRHTNAANATQNLRCDRLQFEMDFL